METGSNLQASRARLAASRATPHSPTSYAGSSVKEALRAIGILDLACSILFGVVLAMQGGGTLSGLMLGGAAVLSGILGCALLFALAAIVENLIAIRRNTEH